MIPLPVLELEISRLPQGRSLNRTLASALQGELPQIHPISTGILGNKIPKLHPEQGETPKLRFKCHSSRSEVHCSHIPGFGSEVLLKGLFCI